MSKHARKAWADVLKGLAIILVVIGHNQEDRDFIFAFHMPLFFLLSGFLFSPKPVKAYLKSSAKRLILPYCAFLVVFTLPEAISLIHSGNWLNGGGNSLIQRVLYGGYYLQGAYGTFWFVTVLWFAANLFNVIIASRMSRWLLPILIIVGYTASLLPFPLPWNIHVVPMALAFIWTGFILKQILEQHSITESTAKKPLLILSAILVLTMIYMLRHSLVMNMKYNDYGIFGLTYITSTIASIAVGALAMAVSSSKMIARILGYIGLASMVIMYGHMGWKHIVLARLGLESNHIVAIVTGLLVSILAFWLCNRWSLTRKYFLGIDEKK